MLFYTYQGGPICQSDLDIPPILRISGGVLAQYLTFWGRVPLALWSGQLSRSPQCCLTVIQIIILSWPPLISLCMMLAVWLTTGKLRWWPSCWSIWFFSLWYLSLRSLAHWWKEERNELLIHMRHQSWIE